MTGSILIVWLLGTGGTILYSILEAHGRQR